jgi:hypothetical protein
MTSPFINYAQVQREQEAFRLRKARLGTNRVTYSEIVRDTKETLRKIGVTATDKER